MPSPTCHNCNASLSGPYCPNCGQRDLPLHEPFWAVLGRIFGELFSLDSRMDRTMRPFLLRPGFLTREHNQGRRALYSAPFRLYLLASLVLFFTIGAQRTLSTWNGHESALEPSGVPASSGETSGGIQFDLGDEEQIRDALGADSWMYAAWSRQRTRFESLPNEGQVDLVVRSALAQMPTMLMLMLPIAALILRLAFLRSGHVFGEHFVFVLHVHAFYCVALLIPTLIHHWIAWALVALLIPTYFLLALNRAYVDRPHRTLLRALVAFPLYLAIFLPMLISLVFLSVLAA